MAGGQGVTGIEAGASSRTEGLREARRWQLRPELRQGVGAEKTEEAVVFKPQAQTIHKQLQVGCSTASVSGEPRLHAGMLAMQICLCNRSQFSLPAVLSEKHSKLNSDGAGKIVFAPFRVHSVVLC